MRLVEKLGLGTVQFGLSYGISNQNGQTSREETSKILHLARKYGINLLDSAAAYENAEEVLGENDISDFHVVSKFLPPSTGAKILDQFEQSLQNLEINFLYAYLAHRPMDILNHPVQWDELLKLKERGKVLKIGFSLNEPKELEELLSEGYFPDLIQVPYNFFDRRFESCISELKKKGCEIHTRSSFLQGLFFLNPDNLDDFFDEVKPFLVQLQKLESLSGALLKFVLEKPFVDKVIVGVENESQLTKNIEQIAEASTLQEINFNISDNILIPSRWPKN